MIPLTVTIPVAMKDAPGPPTLVEANFNYQTVNNSWIEKWGW